MCEQAGSISARRPWGMVSGGVCCCSLPMPPLTYAQVLEVMPPLPVFLRYLRCDCPRCWFRLLCISRAESTLDTAMNVVVLLSGLGRVVQHIILGFVFLRHQESNPACSCPVLTILPEASLC